MNDDQLVRRLPDVLWSDWHRRASSITPLGGGMNSVTALVTADHRQWVAKWVRTGHSAGLHNGARVAARLADAGLRAARPLPTVHGELWIGWAAGSLALLEFVPGRELTGVDRDQPHVAGALARAHTLLGTSSQRGSFFSWLGDDQRLDDVAPWVLPPIRTVTAEFRALPRLTWGTVHADPSPDAFILDEAAGGVGIIDWAGASEGPLMYDLASVVMYLGGPVQSVTFLAHYAKQGPLPGEEISQHLPAFRRFRAIVQADYFARRILTSDLTGINSAAENDKGLSDAEHMLQELNVL